MKSKLLGRPGGVSLGILLASLLCTLNSKAADPSSYADGFEAAVLNAFWTPDLFNGTATVGNTQVHNGTNALILQTTSGGQKNLFLRHAFGKLQYGKVSAWVYDNLHHIYFGFGIQNTTAESCTTGIGVQDWDTSAYYYGVNCAGGKTAVPRSIGWHKFEIECTPSRTILSIDGNVIRDVNEPHPFNLIQIHTSGPGSGTTLWDDFIFEAAPEPVPIQITSLNRNGQMTWTNVDGFINGLFTVEWASQPGTNWHSTWAGLDAFRVSSNSTTVEVPMLYRVRAVTNLVIPWVTGGQLQFNVTNAVGSNWTENIKTLSQVRPTAGNGKDYALVEVIENGEMSTHYMRSTDAAVYRLDRKTLTDIVEFMIAPVGTTWTNYNYEGVFTLKVSVEAVETVNTPAGTFPNCLKFHKIALDAGPGETAEWFEWIYPGFGMVKWIDHWVEPAENPPVVHVLQSWSVTVP